MESFLRILFLTKRFSTGRDVLKDRYGRTHELAAALSQRGHEVIGACFSYYGSLDPPEKDRSGVEWYVYAADRTVVGGIVKYARGLREIVERHQPQLIVGASDSIHVVVAALLAKRCGLPCLVDLYDNFESFMLTKLPFIRFAFRRAVRSADAVSVVSDELAEYVKQTYRPEGEIAVVENAVPPGMFRPIDRREARASLRLPTDGILVGTAGALVANRGIGALYRAFLSLAARNTHLHLALAGPVGRRQSIPRHERIHYLGELEYDQIPIFLNCLDVGVICNLQNAFGSFCFPQKLYEMLACELPVVAADVGVMKRLFRHAPENLYDPCDPESLVETLAAQIVDPVLPALQIPMWSDQGRKLNALISRTATGDGA